MKVYAKFSSNRVKILKFRNGRERGRRKVKGERREKKEYERLKAAEQRLIATASQVNVAEQRLKDSQSQGDD